MCARVCVYIYRCTDLFALSSGLAAVAGASAKEAGDSSFLKQIFPQNPSTRDAGA